jgi:hypothetical protein
LNGRICTEKDARAIQKSCGFNPTKLARAIHGGSLVGQLGDLADLDDDPEVLGSRIADAWKKSPPVVELGGPVLVMTAETSAFMPVQLEVEPEPEPRDPVLDLTITSGLVHTEAAIDTHSTDNAGGAAARDSDSSSVSADVRLDTVSNSSARYFFLKCDSVRARVRVRVRVRVRRCWDPTASRILLASFSLWTPFSKLAGRQCKLRHFFHACVRNVQKCQSACVFACQ